MPTSPFAASLEYAERGFRVIPLRPGSKIPAPRHWPEEASNQRDVVSQQFRDAAWRFGGSPNVGIVTGSGLAVLDLDTHHGGVRPDWAPDTLTASTPSGGIHLYYSVEQPIPNSVGRLGRGLDVRGERGQVAAPPSIIKVYPGRVLHTDGAGDIIGRYVWTDVRPIARIDAFRLIPEDLRTDFTGRSPGFQYREAVPVGERNNYLTSLAGYLYALAEPHTSVLESLNLEVLRLGFSPREGEVESIARSVGRYH